MIRWVGRLLVLVLVLAALVGGMLAAGWQRFTEAGPLSEEATLVIERSSGVAAIARSLERAGIIGDDLLFRVAVRVLGRDDELKAGEYRFGPRASMREVMEKLAAGETVVHRLTVPEGLTSKDIVALLQAAEPLRGDVPNVPPEGSLLPETYHFSRGDSRAEVLARMQDAMRRTLEELWPARAPGLPLGDPKEALVLASIVERETAVPEERPRVAAVFINRLRKGMKLQSDPTVIYGLSDGDGEIDRALTRKDLRTDHPYNTYVHRGLPPAPISNPGRASIAAVLNPARTDDLYFVADGSGGHVFAKTLDEHNRNVAAWRRLRKDSRNQ